MASTMFRGSVLFALMTALFGLTSSLPAHQVDDEDAYRIQHSAYEEARSKENVEEKAAAFLTFIQRFPNSRLLDSAISEYQFLIREAYESGTLEQLIQLGEDFLRVRRGDVTALYYLACGTFNGRNMPAAIDYGEKLLEVTEDAEVRKQIYYVLGFAALVTKDDSRIMKYGERACAGISARDCYGVRIEQMRIALSRKQEAAATNYAQLVLEAVQDMDARDPATKAYVAENLLTAHLLLGNQLYGREQWQSAIKHFRYALSASKEPAVRAETHYRIGLAEWKLERTGAAMENFAHGCVLGGPFASKCRMHLETLYKVRHNGSTAGIEEYIAKANADG